VTGQDIYVQENLLRQQFTFKKIYCVNNLVRWCFTGPSQLEVVLNYQLKLDAMTENEGSSLQQFSRIEDNTVDVGIEKQIETLLIQCIEAVRKGEYLIRQLQPLLKEARLSFNQFVRSPKWFNIYLSAYPMKSKDFLISEYASHTKTSEVPIDELVMRDKTIMAVLTAVM
jgi:hypothetical protein